MVSIEQIKAARAMLGMKQTELAKKAGISIATLNNIERGAQTDPKLSTVKAIQGALEKEGVEFITDALGSTGVCLKPHRPSRHATVLIVDDNGADRALYKAWLTQQPDKQYNIVEADGAKAGLDAFLGHRPDCIILDFMMYGADGFQLLATLRHENIKLPPIIFVTGMSSEVLEDHAKAQGVHSYLDKKRMTAKDLCTAVHNALTP